MGDNIRLGSVSFYFLLNLQAQFVVYDRLLNDLRQQPVTEPEPISSPINYPA